jgi:molecular chaperone Hsp33
MSQDTIQAEELAVNLAGDDMVTPFAVKPLGVRGRVVRLGPSVAALLERHGYPPAVSSVLAEAAGLVALLGSTLKFDGKFILQTRTDGPVDMIVVDFVTPGDVRGYAHFDADKVAELVTDGAATQQALLGQGHLVMTIDQGAEMERYQGVVAFSGENLSAAAHDYFQQSEQIPTSVRLAAGPVISHGSEGREEWRMGGIMVQHLPAEGSPSALAISSGDAPAAAQDEAPEQSEEWTRARVLMESVEDHELLDPTVTTDRLLYRLFHEDGVTAYQPLPIAHHCHCSRERIKTVLDGFSPEEIASTVEEGNITVTCEFCSAQYEFTEAEL